MSKKYRLYITSNGVKFRLHSCSWMPKRYWCESASNSWHISHLTIEEIDNIFVEEICQENT